MAEKKKSKKKKASRVEQMRAMRESAPNAGEPTDVQETKAQRRKREAKEKKEAQRAEKQAQKEAAKKAKAEAKAAKKREREEKAAARKAEKEAKRKPKTGALTVEQYAAVLEASKVEVLPPLKEPSEEEKDKMAADADRKMRDLDGKIKSATTVLLGVIQWDLFRRIVNPATGKKDFKTVGQWAKSAMPVCYSQNYAIIKSIAKLGPYLSNEDLASMPMRNRQLLIENPSVNLKDEEIIRAAKGSKKGLVKKLKEKHPELHIEDSSPAMIPQSAKEKFEEAIEAFMALNGCDRAEAIEGIGEYFMLGLTENEEFSGMSNRDAYAALKERQEEAALGPEEELNANEEQSA